jgi:hypothetical protein
MRSIDRPADLVQRESQHPPAASPRLRWPRPRDGRRQINPSILLVPALAVFVVNGIVLLVLRPFVGDRQSTRQPARA